MSNSSGVVVWSREEEKAFENAIATHWTGQSKAEWDKIAAMVPSKTVDELKHHLEILFEDVNAIEAGLVTLPDYIIIIEDDEENATGQAGGYKGGRRGSTVKERRRGRPWTQEEHRLFLAGLEQYGKGDWKSISRNAVQSRTPTQVASHAQKYFNRLNSTNKDNRRRSSIHDITIGRNRNNIGDGSSHQQH